MLCYHSLTTIQFYTRHLEVGQLKDVQGARASSEDCGALDGLSDQERCEAQHRDTTCSRHSVHVSRETPRWDKTDEGTDVGGLRGQELHVNNILRIHGAWTQIQLAQATHYIGISRVVCSL